MGVVQKGNKIFVPAGELINTEITVKWKQGFKDRIADYYSVPFYNKDQGTHTAYQPTANITRSSLTD